MNLALTHEFSAGDTVRKCGVNRLPIWLKQEMPDGKSFSRMRALAKEGIHTVCQHAQCPNSTACLRRASLTFLILGATCTRNCTFCAVDKATEWPLPVDEAEPERIARIVRELGILYTVITSVTRDDLIDQGAGHFALTIRAIREKCPGVLIEVLIPDFCGDISSLRTVLDARPDCIGHNLETVPRLYPAIRPQADYLRSLAVLRHLKSLPALCLTKSSLMLGLSETEDEVVAVMRDLRGARCDILTLGQYLAPSIMHAPVREFVSPGKFDRYNAIAKELGFKAVLSAPLARSSYKADEVFKEALQCTM